MMPAHGLCQTARTVTYGPIALRHLGTNESCAGVTVRLVGSIERTPGTCRAEMVVVDDRPRGRGASFPVTVTAVLRCGQGVTFDAVLSEAAPWFPDGSVWFAATSEFRRQIVAFNALHP